MPLLYANEYLDVATPEADAWLARSIPPGDVHEYVFPLWSPLAFPRTVVQFRNPQLTPLRGVRLGSLFWPTGASRWATFHGLVTDEQLAAIRATVYPGGGEQVPADLVLADPNGSTITASMWMLPPRPLAQIAGKRQLYLLSLADDRYRWWWRRGTLEVIEGFTTWADLYEQLGTFLGITVLADPVDADYLLPTRFFGMTFLNLPVLLDEVARQCGQKIVRELDGTVRALNYASSRSRFDAASAAAARRRAGGTFALTA